MIEESHDQDHDITEIGNEKKIPVRVKGIDDERHRRCGRVNGIGQHHNGNGQAGGEGHGPPLRADKGKEGQSNQVTKDASAEEISRLGKGGFGEAEQKEARPAQGGDEKKVVGEIGQQSDQPHGEGCPQRDREDSFPVG